MADLPIHQKWLVSPSAEAERKWLMAQIQEKKSRIVRFTQDKEDLLKGRTVEIEGNIIMLEKEIKELQAKLSNPDKPVD